MQKWSRKTLEIMAVTEAQSLYGDDGDNDKSYPQVCAHAFACSSFSQLPFFFAGHDLSIALATMNCGCKLLTSNATHISPSCTLTSLVHPKGTLFLLFVKLLNPAVFAFRIQNKTIVCTKSYKILPVSLQTSFRNVSGIVQRIL